MIPIVVHVERNDKYLIEEDWFFPVLPVNATTILVNEIVVFLNAIAFQDTVMLLP